MAVTIRLRRMGSKKRPFYRFVAADQRMPRDGRFIEVLGYYHPIEKPARISLEEERIYYWLEQGARPSETVSSLFKEVGLLEKWAKKKKGEDTADVELKTEITERIKKAKKAKEKSEK